MGLINIQKQKCIYIKVQLYTCAFPVSHIFVITIFSRQKTIKADIILACVDGSLFKKHHQPDLISQHIKNIKKGYY
jgi:hypothetical protein